MKYTRFNPRCYSETKWSGGDDGVGAGDDGDDDPNEVQLDDDGDDSPPPSGKEFPRQISLCRRAFLSLVFFASQRWRKMFLVAPRVLGFWEDEIREEAPGVVGQGGHTMPRRGRAWGWCGPPVAPLRLSFWLPPSSDDI